MRFLLGDGFTCFSRKLVLRLDQNLWFFEKTGPAIGPVSSDFQENWSALDESGLSSGHSNYINYVIENQVDKLSGECYNKAENETFRFIQKRDGIKPF